MANNPRFSGAFVGHTIAMEVAYQEGVDRVFRDGRPFRWFRIPAKISANGFRLLDWEVPDGLLAPLREVGWAITRNVDDGYAVFCRYGLEDSHFLVEARLAKPGDDRPVSHA